MHVFQIIKQKENDDKNKHLLNQANLFEYDKLPVYSEIEQFKRKVAEAEEEQAYVKTLMAGRVEDFKT